MTIGFARHTTGKKRVHPVHAKKKKVRRDSRTGFSVDQSGRVRSGHWLESFRKDVPPYLFNMRGTAKKPYFLIDENLPLYVVKALREDGDQVVHVTRLFRQGAPDEHIKRYAESRNAIIITRDTTSFPEPKFAGDRIVVADLPREKTITEIRRRKKQLGW